AKEMSPQGYKTAYVMVHLPSKKEKPGRSYVVSPVPFTEAKLAPGGKIQIDKICSSYLELKEALRRDFGIEDSEIPGPEYFEPTPEEEAYDEDRILRVVPADPEEMSWEADARRAVRQALENAEWDFDEKTVTLFDRDEPRINKPFESLEDLQDEL